MNRAIELLINAAEEHAAETGDFYMGDLSEHLRLMWGILTPEQRSAYLRLERVEEMFEMGDARYESLGAAVRAISGYQP